MCGVYQKALKSQKHKMSNILTKKEWHVLPYGFPESFFFMYFQIISWQRKQTKKMLFQYLNFSIQIPRRSNSILATVLFTT